MLDRIAAGRTDLVFEYLAAGNAPDSLLRECAYYGDVSAMKMLLAAGESLPSLGEDIGFIGACFHGHWFWGVSHSPRLRGHGRESSRQAR